MIKRGFTLVEIMISVGLMAVLAVGVNTYFISSLRSARKSATNSIVKSEGEMIQANIVQAVKFAKRINSCTATSLSLLDSEGADVSYTVTTVSGVNFLNYVKIPPQPTPTVTYYLNTNKTKVQICTGDYFSCTTGGKTVDMCFVLASSGAGDVTEATSMKFQNFIYTAN